MKRKTRVSSQPPLHDKNERPSKTVLGKKKKGGGGKIEFEI